MDSKNIFKRILYYMNPKHIEPKMVKLWAFWIVFWVVLFLVPTKMVTGSFWILVPLAGLFVYALVTKDVMQSLVLGTFSCYILWYKGACFGGFINDLYTVLGDPENIEMYMSFFLCGGLYYSYEANWKHKGIYRVCDKQGKGKSSCRYGDSGCVRRCDIGG